MHTLPFPFAKPFFVNLHKRTRKQLAITDKNHNKHLSKYHRCIKILPERWSVPVACIIAGQHEEQSTNADLLHRFISFAAAGISQSAFVPCAKKGERFYHEEETTGNVTRRRYVC